jgi:hypothetical protein
VRSSKIIGTVALVALLAATYAEAQRGKKAPRPRKRRPTTTQPRPADSIALPPPPTTAVTPPPPPVRSTPPSPPSSDARKTVPPAASPAPSPPAGLGAARSATPPATSALPFVTLGLEPQWEGRYFRHTEFTAPNVRSYDANGYASLALTAEIFPLVKVSPHFWRGFGLTLRYARAFGFQSDSTRLGAPLRTRSLPVETDFSRYAIGLRYRILLNAGGAMPVVVATSASFVGWDFDFGSALPAGPDLEAPTAAYRMIRLGFDGTFQLRPITVFWALGYLHALSIAAPSSRKLDELRYPHLPTAVGMGGEIRGAVGLAVWRSVELRLSGEFAVLAFHLKSVEGRADEPARVVDSYVAVGLGPYVSF